MSDQHREDVVRGVEARNAKPVLDRAFDRVRTAMIEKLLKTSPSEREEILGLHSSIQGIDAARTAVAQEIGAGDMAQTSLDARDLMAKQQQL